jgi:hypothetical protein
MSIYQEFGNESEIEQRYSRKGLTHRYFINKCPSINGLFAQSLRLLKKIILGISFICLRLFF